MESSFTTMLFAVSVMCALNIFVTVSAEFDCLGTLRKDKRMSEDGRLPFMELTAKYGHPAEQHYVVTEDGYNITVFHIPGNITKPILLLHGNTADADVWVVRGATSLAITLAKLGYDVWAVSYRGSVYSNRHVSIDPVKDPNRFYNYGFYEQGYYDTASAIDLVVQKTGQKEIVVIGHSIGSTSYFILASERPEYNNKVKLFISLASIVFVKHQIGLANIGSYLGPIANTVGQFLNVSRISGCYSYGDYLFRSFCLEGSLAYDICVKVNIFGGSGPDEAGLEPEFTSTLFGHFPGASTRKISSHYAQLYLRDEFANYDYGPVKNLVMYGSPVPPKFDLRKVTSKVGIFVGKMDFLSPEADNIRLSKALPNVVYHQLLPYENFNHIDFIFGRHMHETFYPYLLGLIDQYI